MANHIKYHTEEERKAANRAYFKKFREKQIREGGREGVSNPCKHKRISYDGIKVDIGTMNRTALDTAYIELMVTVSYTNDEKSLELFKTNVHKQFNVWLKGQDMWDKKNRIAIMECAKSNPDHKGKYKTLTFQYHVRRDEITPWKETADNLMVLVEVLLDEIKKTCDETGLVLMKWAPHAKKDLAAAAAAESPSTPSTEVD